MPKSFLSFEKRKIVLPVVLLLLLGYVYVSDEYNYAKIKPLTDKTVYYVFETLRLTVYNATLNGTDAAINSELTEKMKAAIDYNAMFIQEFNASREMTNTALKTLNLFGTNFCIISDSNSFFYLPDNCSLTKTDEVLLIKFDEISCKTAMFSVAVAGNRSLDMKSFMRTDEGRNFFNKHSECTPRSIEDIRKWSSFVDISFEGMERKYNLRTMPSVDYLFYALMLVAEGYLISCLIVWAFEKKQEQKRKKRK